MKFSNKSALLVASGCILAISSVLAITSFDANQPSNQSESTSTVENYEQGHTTTTLSIPRVNATFQSDYSVALSVYQHLKSYENNGSLVHRIDVSFDSTRTWALTSFDLSGIGPAHEYMHMVSSHIVWLGIGSAGPCPAPKAVCDSFTRGSDYVVNHVGGSVVFQKPISATISVSYVVWGASCSEIGTLEGAFFRDPQFGDEFGWFETLTSEDGEGVIDQGDTVPTCTLAFPGTLDYLPIDSSSLKVCIRTSYGYLEGNATFDHNISPTRVVYSYVKDAIGNIGSIFTQSCAGESA